LPASKGCKTAYAQRAMQRAPMAAALAERIRLDTYKA
jgi:hypothetical protein